MVHLVGTLFREDFTERNGYVVSRDRAVSSGSQLRLQLL